MYTEHPLINTPNDDVVIWRYMNFAKFINLLEHSSLYFTRADKFDDKFEGCRPQKNMEIINYLPVEQRIKDLILSSYKSNSNAQLIYINCWQMKDSESYAMWDRYAQSNEGIAIKSTIGDLKECLKLQQTEVFIGKIDYINYDNHFIKDENNMLPYYFHKKDNYSNEYEVRAAFLDPTLSEYGIDQPITLEHLIKDIYTGPNTQSWFIKLVEDMLKKYQLGHIQVKQSSMNDSPNY